jgi:hypothetical protein
MNVGNVVGCARCAKRTCKYLQMYRYLILSADVDIYLISSTDKIIENHPGWVNGGDDLYSAERGRYVHIYYTIGLGVKGAGEGGGMS